MRDVVAVNGLEIYIIGSMGLAFRGPKLVKIAHVGSEDLIALRKPRRLWRRKDADRG